MPRNILSKSFVVLVVAFWATNSDGFRPQSELDEWPTLQFKMRDSKLPEAKVAYYTFGSGEVISIGETIIKEKPGQPTALKSPLSINIKGATPSWIKRWPITPQTETVLLIDQVYNASLPDGGITEKSQIVHERPYGGWAQRFLFVVEQNERDRKAMKKGGRGEANQASNSLAMASKLPTLHLPLEPYEVALSPGKHTIQVLMLDAHGKPIIPSIVSKYSSVVITE